MYLSVHFFSSVRILCEFHFFSKEFVAKYTVIVAVLRFRRCMIFVNFNALLGGPEEITWPGQEVSHAISFQSRFGKQEWIKPYTDVVLEDWAKQGVKSVQVMSPAFSADCLETLEELAIENAETFKSLGGGSYRYIPALNSREDHLRLLNSLLQANLDALTQTLAH